MHTSTLVLGSKFIASLAPAATIGEADAHLLERTRRYPDASHHCWAYRIGRPHDLVERSSDAGEPSGTAGRPILDALHGAHLENVSCVVTRYFGGTKLGTGGLVRAYADAASEVIASASTVTKSVVRAVAISFAHEHTGLVYRVLAEFDVTLTETRFDDRAHGSIKVPASRTGPMRNRIQELARDAVSWDEGELSLL